MEEPVAENEKNVAPEQQLGEDVVNDENKEDAAKEPEEKEPEDKVSALICSIDTLISLFL